MKGNITSVFWAALPWCAALGIHGVLLFAPFSTLTNPSSKSTTPGRVRVVDSSTPQPQPPAPALPPIPENSASTLAVVKRRPPAPAPPLTNPKPPAKPSTPPKSVAAAVRSPQRPKLVSPSPKPTPQPSPPVTPNDLVVNLAQLPDTQPCHQVNGCWKSEKSQWRSVYAKVQQQITSQGYRVTELELEDDTGFRVSQIAKNGQTKYFLHLLSTLEGTIYILNSTQLSKEEVEQRIAQT